jgi:hypothetical protein
MTGMNICLLDLSNEILFTILKKLDNMNVLYSLIGISIERLDLLAKDKIFTNTLNFVLTDVDDVCSIPDPILNRFCNDILPQIHCNVRCLTFESMIMERILLAGDFPNLTQLKMFKFNRDFVLRYFIGN